MSIWTIINPWGAVRALQAEIDHLTTDIQHVIAERNRYRDSSLSAEKKNARLMADFVALRTRTQMQKEEIMRLTAVVNKLNRNRDPVTGRFLSEVKEP